MKLISHGSRGATKRRRRLPDGISRVTVDVPACALSVVRLRIPHAQDVCTYAAYTQGRTAWVGRVADPLRNLDFGSNYRVETHADNEASQGGFLML